jgi:Zn-dependent peptidase ImmA (M78 family)
MARRLGQFLSESKLYIDVRNLAARRRREINENNLKSLVEIATHYHISLVEDKLPDDKDGSWVSSQRKIILNIKIRSVERRNFTFFHELMHSFIDDDDDLISDIHESLESPNILIERLCNVGAAELLIPTDNIRTLVAQSEFTSKLIPTLCENHRISGITAGIHMATTAQHACYLIIAEPVTSSNELLIRYSAKSFAAKYTISKRARIPKEHLIYEVFSSKFSVSGRTLMFTAKSKQWPIYGDAIYYKEYVYAFLHETVPVSSTQLKLPLDWSS